MRIDYDKDQLAYALANALKERDDALSQIAQAECRAERFCQERDEARIDAQKSKAYKRVLKETNLRQTERIRYLEGATNHACGTPLSVALKERDEAREEAAHWKSEWEIVEARLCGWKHPRDNGIIFEHEVIPVLRKERDEAKNEILGWENKWKCAVDMAARAEIERDDALNKLKELKDILR